MRLYVYIKLHVPYFYEILEFEHFQNSFSNYFMIPGTVFFFPRDTFSVARDTFSKIDQNMHVTRKNARDNLTAKNARDNFWFARDKNRIFLPMTKKNARDIFKE